MTRLARYLIFLGLFASLLGGAAPVCAEGERDYGEIEQALEEKPEHGVSAAEASSQLMAAVDRVFKRRFYQALADIRANNFAAAAKNLQSLPMGIPLLLQAASSSCGWPWPPAAPRCFWR